MGGEGFSESGKPIADMNLTVMCDAGFPMSLAEIEYKDWLT